MYIYIHGHIGVRAIQDNPTTARITFFDHTICPLQRLVELLEDQHRRWNDGTKSPQFSRGLYTHYKDFLLIQEFSNKPLEHTPDPEPTVYEGIPFIWGFGEAWGMLQGYVGVLLELKVG